MAEPQAQADPTATARARLRGKRIALGIVITVTVAYIGASAVDIVPAVFGAVMHPLPSAPPGTPARVCAEGLRRLVSTPETGGDDEVQRACAASREGLDAWAALERLRSAERQLARPARAGTDERSGSEQELQELRRQVLAHLPAELR
ncbi:MAG TPA: hypothetical protein VMI75_01340 [Polyangiaceae bacterium]|nr:hypothetical protein [Polyangiaceae bacterium]